MVENELSLLNREAEAAVLPDCSAHGVAFVPYYPLFNGLLTGKYQRGAAHPVGARITEFAEERQAAIFSDENFDRIERLEAFSSERGHTLLQLAFAWLLSKEAVASVIAGATSPGHQSNAEAADWVLTAEEADEINRLIAVPS